MTTQQYGTVRTYAFIGFIFYGIAAAAGILGLLILGVLFATSISTVTSTFPTTPPPTSITVFPFFTLILVIFGIFFIPAIVLTFFAWSTVKAIDAGRYAQARTNTLILGIIGLVFGIVIGGIFFLLSYANLGIPPQAYQPQPQTQKFCVNCGRPVSPNDRYCPHCGEEQPT